jgi:hypothetical protein
MGRAAAFTSPFRRSSEPASFESDVSVGADSNRRAHLGLISTFCEVDIVLRPQFKRNFGNATSQHLGKDRSIADRSSSRNHCSVAFYLDFD